MMEETSCDGVAVGPCGAGQPVDFQPDSRRHGGQNRRRTHKRGKARRAHAPSACARAAEGRSVAVREMRRHIVCYVRGMRDAARLRVKVNAITEIDEMEAALTAFMLEGKA